MWGKIEGVHGRGRAARAALRPDSADYRAAQQRAATAARQQRNNAAPDNAAPDNASSLRRQTSENLLSALREDISAEGAQREHLVAQAASDSIEEVELQRTLSATRGSIGSLLRARRNAGTNAGGAQAPKGQRQPSLLQAAGPTDASNFVANSSSSAESYSDDDDFEDNGRHVLSDRSPTAVGSDLLHACDASQPADHVTEQAWALPQQLSGEALQHERAKRVEAEQAAAQQAALLASLTAELNKQTAELRRERQGAAEARTAAAQAAEKAAAAEAAAVASAAAAAAIEQQQQQQQQHPPAAGQLLATGPQTCVICFDEFTRYGEGVSCTGPDRHYLCVECFRGCIDAAVDSEPRQQEMRSGRIFCPLCVFPPPPRRNGDGAEAAASSSSGCPAEPFDDQTVARLSADAAQFGRYTRMRERLTEARLAKEAAAAQAAAVERHLQKIEEMGAEVFKAREHIIERILTLQCPRCSQAFIDWNGCVALTCAAAGCGCGFCGWCLADCGEDAHHHIQYECSFRATEFDPTSDYFFPKKEQVEVQDAATTHAITHACQCTPLTRQRRVP